MEDQKSKIPVIKCKKKMYDFYKSNTSTKEKPTLASHGWKNKKTRDDYFFIYPYGNVYFTCNNFWLLLSLYYYSFINCNSFFRMKKK